MRSVLRKAIVGVVVAAAAVMLAPLAASAAPVEIESTETGQHWSGEPGIAWVSSSFISLSQHLATGTVVRGNCVITYGAEFDENGEAEIAGPSMSISGGSPSCGTSITPCWTTTWHMVITHDGIGNEEADFEMCLRVILGVSPLIECAIRGDMTLDVGEGGFGTTTFEANDATWDIESVVALTTAFQPQCNGFVAAGALEFDGPWYLEEDLIEIHHL